MLTLVGNRPEWVLTMVACFRQGFVVLPCTEQLRAEGPRAAARRRRGRAGRRRRAQRATCSSRAGWSGPTVWAPWDEPARRDLPPPAELAPDDPCLITFTSGTAGEPKAVLHGQRYLPGQRLQAEHWLARAPGELVWCTAASGWSKSARNAFIAPWLRGAAALLHDARFDPAERLELLERERVDVLCMAPTEYRVIAKRATLRAVAALRGLVAAGRGAQPRGPARLARRDRALDPRRLRPDRDRPAHRRAARRSRRAPARWAARSRASGSTSSTASSCSTPRRDPTFFLRYLGEDGRPPGGRRAVAHRRPRRAQDEDGYLHFEGRTDDVIISAGYRIGPFEVESALVAHPAVAEAAVVAAPDDERGAVVRAVVVLRDGHEPSDALARELQDHVKAETAPYKYPRVVDFADGAAEDREREGPPRAASRGDNRTSTARPAPVPRLADERHDPCRRPHRSRPRRRADRARARPPDRERTAALGRVLRARQRPSCPAACRRPVPAQRPVARLHRARRAARAVWDVDGNEYLDFHNGFGVMCVGHANPAIAAAVKAQMDEGTHFAAPTEGSIVVAEELRRRWGLPHWRFTNSGTESTMDAIHLARGVTGRDADRQDRGHLPRPPRRGDGLRQAAAPRRWATARGPPRVPTASAIPSTRTDLTRVVPFNDADAMERAARTRATSPA